MFFRHFLRRFFREIRFFAKGVGNFGSKNDTSALRGIGRTRRLNRVALYLNTGRDNNTIRALFEAPIARIGMRVKYMGLTIRLEIRFRGRSDNYRAWCPCVRG